MDELMDLLLNRIKLEHSYALTCNTFRIECSKFEDEDPLKISPEDFNIKIEDEEDIEIKQEDVGECIDIHCINEQFEIHSCSNSPTLQPYERSDSCNNIADCLELKDNCDVASKIDNFESVNGESFDVVPKQVFLAFQQNYEKTIRDLKIQNEKILLEAARLTEENVKLQREIDKAPFDRLSVLTHANLVAEIVKLREEVRASRTREHIREQSLKATGRSVTMLYEINSLKRRLDHAQTQLKRLEQLRDDNFNTIRKTNCELNDLKAQLSTKEAELKGSEGKCVVLASRLSCLVKENAIQKSTLAKIHKHRNAIGKELYNSIRIRQILTERAVRLNKKLPELKTCKLKLKETDLELARSIHRVKELEKLNDVERKKNSYLAKERDQLLQEQQIKHGQIQKQLFDANQALSVARTMLTRKMDESKNLREGFMKATMQLNLKELLLKNKEEEVQKKDEAYRTKVCEYCGFC